MKDITPNLLNAITNRFNETLKSDKVIIRYFQKIDAGKGTYKDASECAAIFGDALSKSFSEVLTTDSLPDGKMYYNIAERILNERLKANHKIVTEMISAVQQSLNEKGRQCPLLIAFKRIRRRRLIIGQFYLKGLCFSRSWLQIS